MTKGRHDQQAAGRMVSTSANAVAFDRVARITSSAFVQVGDRLQETGIGPALRKARLLRGKSLEEASRETHIRADYLRALERERFDALLGDVYVRGFLRSYSTYLGLDPTKVLTVYNRHFGPSRIMLPDPAPAPKRSGEGPHPHLPGSVIRHPTWTFMIGVALLVLAIFGAVGLLSHSKIAPLAGSGGKGPGAISALPPKVTVALQAASSVEATVSVDGRIAFQGMLRANEARSFEGNSRIDLELATGGTTVVTVNGHRIGKPGSRKGQYAASFGPQDFRGSASPGKSP
jgi:cytoskeleton protein RodZ